MKNPQSSPRLTIYWVNQYAVPPDQPGGTRHYDFASELVARGHQVRLLASDLNLTTRTYSRRRSGTDIRPIHERANGVDFAWLTAGSYRSNDWRRVASMMVFFVAAFAYLVRQPMRRAASVVVGSSPHLFAALAAYIAARLRRVPFVLEVRDLWPESYIEVSGRTRGIQVSVMWAIARFLYRHADSIIVLAEPNRERIAAFGVPMHRIHYIPNGVLLDNVVQASAGQSLHDPSRFTFVYAGAHGPANGLEVVLQACQALDHEQVNDIRVVLIGDGPIKPDLVKDADRMGLTNVQFLDPIPKSQIAATLATADAGLMVLAATELFTYGVSPNKLFDYFAAELPVLTNVGGWVSELVVNGGAGIAVQPGDPLALAEGMKALAHTSTPEQRSQFGKHGAVLVRAEFDRRMLARRIEEILKNSLDPTAQGEPVIPRPDDG